MEHDLIVIGGGPGGYVAAVRSAQLGLKTLVLEKGNLGGVCLNLGCIPTKSLIKSADTAYTLSHADEHGVEIAGSVLNFSKAHARSRRIADINSKAIAGLFKKHGITVIRDKAALVSGNKVKAAASGMEYEARNILVATGSSPKTLPGFETDNDKILNSEQFILKNTIPKSILILGAGAIDVEFGYVLNAFGCEVTLIELLDSVLPLEDRETGRAVERELKKKKIKVKTSARALSARKAAAGVELAVEKSGKQETLSAETLLIAVGRAPNTGGLGLEQAGVKTDPRGFIEINEYGRTSVPSVYAAGDCVNTPLLAHVASHEGVLAVEHIAGTNPCPIDYSRVPSCTYITPQAASFGPSEEKLREKGVEYLKGFFSLKASGKALTLGENSGFVKILADKKDGKILSAHIVAPEAAELIHEILAAQAGGLPASGLGRVMHAHPTLAESVMEAALALSGKAVHG